MGKDLSLDTAYCIGFFSAFLGAAPEFWTT